MPFPLNDLGTALTTQIYQTVMGGDGNVKPPEDTFFTWVTPGLPFTPAELDFCSQGIFSAPSADEMKTRLNHAFNLATLMDFIPDVDAAYSNDRQQGMYKPDAEKRLSEMYRQILRFSKVVDYELTEEQQAKLKKFHDLLFVTKTVKDLVTDEEKQVTEESPLKLEYDKRQAAYLAAVSQYNAKRVAAAGASGPEGRAAVADWALNQQNYYTSVKLAADDWMTAGYRNQVDEINAYINQTTQRSLLLWKQQLLERYDQAMISSTEVPIPFPYTTLVPGNLANAGGWTNLGVSHNQVQWAKDNQATSWNAGAGIWWGFFGFDAGVSRQSSQYTETHQVSEFGMSFDMCQALIVRAGFYPEFFANRGWTLRKGEGWMFDDMPSDGGRPPKGEFIGYATQAIFARNLVIRSREFVSAYRAAQSSFSGSGGVGWGPFRLSGGYSRSDAHEDFDSTDDGQTLTVPGMQIIGFVNHLIGMAPNPLDDLEDEDFV